MLFLFLFYLCACARDKVIGCVCLSVSLSDCQSIRQSVSLHKNRQSVLQIQAILLMPNCAKHWKAALSVLLFATYTLQTPKILCFWVGIVGTPINHTQIPGHHVSCIMRDDGFSVPKVHCTLCICETTVCFLSSRKHTHSYMACNICALQSFSSICSSPLKHEHLFHIGKDGPAPPLEECWQMLAGKRGEVDFNQHLKGIQVH